MEKNVREYIDKYLVKLCISFAYILEVDKDNLANELIFEFLNSALFEICLLL